MLLFSHLLVLGKFEIKFYHMLNRKSIKNLISKISFLIGFKLMDTDGIYYYGYTVLLRFAITAYSFFTANNERFYMPSKYTVIKI